MSTDVLIGGIVIGYLICAWIWYCAWRAHR